MRKGTVFASGVGRWGEILNVGTFSLSVILLEISHDELYFFCFSRFVLLPGRFSPAGVFDAA